MPENAPEPMGLASGITYPTAIVLPVIFGQRDFEKFAIILFKPTKVCILLWVKYWVVSFRSPSFLVENRNKTAWRVEAPSRLKQKV